MSIRRLRLTFTIKIQHLFHLLPLKYFRGIENLRLMFKKKNTKTFLLHRTICQDHRSAPITLHPWCAHFLRVTTTPVVWMREWHGNKLYEIPLPLLYQGSSINYDLCYIMDCDTSSDPSYILLYINKGARLLICTCTHSLFNSSLKPVTKCKSSFTPTNVYKGLQYHVITSTHIIICHIIRGTCTFFIDKICVRATTVKVPIRRNKFVLILIALEAQFHWWSQALQTWQGHNSIALVAL